jgi:hypothetical protein
MMSFSFCDLEREKFWGCVPTAVTDERQRRWRPANIGGDAASMPSVGLWFPGKTKGREGRKKMPVKLQHLRGLFSL